MGKTLVKIIILTSSATSLIGLTGCTNPEQQGGIRFPSNINQIARDYAEESARIIAKDLGITPEEVMEHYAKTDGKKHELSFEELARMHLDRKHATFNIENQLPPEKKIQYWNTPITSNDRSSYEPQKLGYSTTSTRGANFKASPNKSSAYSTKGVHNQGNPYHRMI